MMVKISLCSFLIGLNESYDNIKIQILLMDSLPSINEAYSMILRVKKQRLLLTQL